jgi:hypothetical protein
MEMPFPTHVPPFRLEDLWTTSPGGEILLTALSTSRVARADFSCK